MIRRLRLRFVCVNMAIVLVMLSAMFAMAYVLTQQDVARRSREFLRMAAVSPVLAERRAEAGTPHPPYLLLEIDSTGTVTVLTSNGVSVETPEELQALAERVLGEERTEGVLEEENLRYCGCTIPKGIRRVAVGDISGERWTMEGMVRNFVFIAFLSLGIFFFISILLARWATGPVERAWRGQRQFVADASHELKTPLTVILANGELLQSSGNLGEQNRQRVENITAESRQMRTLVERLLELARADSGIPREELEPLAFSALVERILLSFEAVFFESGHPLHWEIQPELWVRGCARRLGQVVEILLDNANKYAAPGGRVEVGLRREEKSRCLLWVRSQGDAIPREELERIFRRFYRADEARSAGGSYGLGLSIASAVVAEHRGRIWAESGAGGNVFYVRLPLDKQRR